MKRFSVALVAGLMVSGVSVPGLAVEFNWPLVGTVKKGKDQPKGNDDPIVPVNGKPKNQQNQPKPTSSDDPIVPINLQPPLKRNP